ncbi:hypothetical protein GCM10011371_26140 [Novosphingobium marinum]|uniref:META domain-containing protein n=1 Tax=Novosphingobium marinum TaxID=1514948 RepID=A0A7Y9XX98_9SPHN|nr:hypothetical protein [Novosphingobium marinum]NYH94771.1 hypothetical protein [Novosphingobium marinum]GGC37431.1 hypothetical protein GCM10011371_26140 [Novosphingobium marinum]
MNATMRGAFALLPLALAACAPAAEDGAAPPENAQSGPEAPTTLAGGWRVAGIDGEELDGPEGIGLLGDEDTIWWSPRCAGQERAYRISGGTIETGAGPAAEAQPSGVPPPAVCTIGLPAGLEDVMRALDAAERIERTPENGVRISGGGHSLLLFSQ